MLFFSFGVLIVLYCPNCGSEIHEGLSFCENCNTRLPKDLFSKTQSNIQNSNQSFGNLPFVSKQSTNGQNQVFQQTIQCPQCHYQPVSPMGCPKCGWKPNKVVIQARKPDGTVPKGGNIELVSEEPRMIRVKEIRDVLLSWSVIYLGFTLQRFIYLYLLSGLDIAAIFQSGFYIQTFIFIIAIFGPWFILEKFVSRYFHLYTEFNFDSSRAIFSFLAALIFFGIPPGYNSYKVHISHPPKGSDIPKIQMFVFTGLLLWGFIMLSFIVYIVQIYNIQDPNVIFIESIPFFLAVSVGFNLIPFEGSAGWLIYRFSRPSYIALICMTVLMILISFNFYAAISTLI